MKVAGIYTIGATMSVESEFVFTAQPTERQFRDASRLINRQGFWFLRALGLALLGFGVLMLLFDGPEDRTLGIVLLVMGLFVGLAGPGLVVRKATRVNLKALGKPISYRIDADGVWSASDLTEGIFRWPAVTGIDQVPGMAMVRVGRSQYVPVPFDGLPPETAAELLAYMRAHAGGKPAAVGQSDLTRPPTP
jgi:hypothetical protein